MMAWPTAWPFCLCILVAVSLDEDFAPVKQMFLLSRIYNIGRHIFVSNVFIEELSPVLPSTNLAGAG